MLTEINGNIDATYPIITGELTGYLGPIGTVTASADNSVGTPHVIVTQTPTPDGLDIDFAFKEMGIPGLDLTVEQDLTEEQQQTARENIDAQEALTFDAAPTQGSQNPVTSGGVYNSVADINAKIPAAASAQNKLADKEYVDDSINRTSAFFRGNFATYADLMAVAWQTTDPDAANYVSNNDYAFVAADETHSGESWRYIYVLEEGGQDNGWAAQYRVNESSLTPEQLAALNSGITSQGVSQIETNRQGLASHVSNTSNPHQVTKAQVGLGNVDNTSDANKPVSTAQQAALDAKQDVIETGFLSNSDNTPYLYRRSGGGLTIGNRAYSKLIGATIAFNQIIPNTSVAAGTFTWSGITGAIKTPANHVFLAETSTSEIDIRFRDSTTGLVGVAGKAVMAKQSTSSVNATIQGNGTATKEFYVMVHDLTQDFGSTIADYAYTLETQTAGSGIAWLKSYGFFSKYAPYDAGSLISTKAEKKKVVGKNQFDKSTYRAGGVIQNGQIYDPSNPDRVHAFIPVIAGKTYTVSGASSSGYQYALYDINENWISSHANVGSPYTITIPANAAYLAVNIIKSVHENTAQVEFGSTATAYTPYTSQEYDLGSDELRGLFKLDANNNIYADGDIKTPDGQITRKYGIVDLGTLEWTLAGGSFPNSFYVYFAASKAPAGVSVPANMICPKYITYSHNAISADATLVGIAEDKSRNLVITDTAYSDAATFKTAMSGVYLVYELATPTTEQGTPYQDPQEVFADGTEEYIDTRTVPVPVGHETDYPGITYLVSKLGNETAFSPFASDVPPAPTSDGTYVLQVSVSSGTPFYRWVSAAELVGE